jgi:ATP-binding cassette subfamily B (MDR/TAP) protein 1
MALGLLGQPMSDLAKARRAAASVLMTLKRKPPIDSFEEGGEVLKEVRGAIEVRDVRFAYPTAPDKLVCNGYSLSVAAGQTCALVGASGSGKSTIVSLLERFYDPQEGAVLLDGVDLRTLNVRWLRSQLGLVGQEPALFVGSVAENIAYGKEGASQAEVEEAARMANAHGFITESLPEGYDTQVGQGGGKLSGGQKQRIAIARTIIKRPAVLLLDEATSALDNESEKLVQASLDEIMAKQKRTTVVIAHRLSTIRDANQIAVVDKGAVVETGTHEDLLDQRGLYANLVQAQQGQQQRGSVVAAVV